MINTEVTVGSKRIIVFSFLSYYLLIARVERYCYSTTHTHTHTRQDFPGRGISPTRKPLPDYKQHLKERQTSMALPGFEPGIPASERPHTHPLDRAATGTGYNRFPVCLKLRHTQKFQHEVTNCYFRSSLRVK